MLKEALQVKVNDIGSKTRFYTKTKRISKKKEVKNLFFIDVTHNSFLNNISDLININQTKAFIEIELKCRFILFQKIFNVFIVGL